MNPTAVFRRHRRAVLLPVVLFILYVLAGFFLTPQLIRWFVLPAVNERLTGEVTIEKIATNPLVFSGTLQGFLLRDTSGEAVFSAGRMHANFQIVSAFLRKWTFYRMELADARLYVSVDRDGSLNLAGLLVPAEESAASEGPAEPLRPLPLRVDLLKVERVALRYADKRFGEDAGKEIEDISFELRNFDTHPDEENPNLLQATTASGERFSWEGGMRFDPLSLSGTLRVEGFQPALYEPFYAARTPFRVEDGRVDLTVSVDFSPLAAEPRLRVFDLAFGLRGLSLQQIGTDEPFLTLGDLQVDVTEVNLLESTAEAPRLAVAEGHLLVTRDGEGLTNLQQMLGEALAAFPQAGGSGGEKRPATVARDIHPEDIRRPVLVALERIAALGSAPWVVRLESFTVDSFALEVRDAVPVVPLRTVVTLEDFAAHNLANTEEAVVDFELAVLTEGEGRLTSTGTLRPLRQEVRCTYTLEEIPLTVVDPYLGSFLHVALVEGRVRGEGSWEITPGEVLPRLRGEHRLEVHDFSLRETLGDTPLLHYDALRLDGIAVDTEVGEVAVQAVVLDGLSARLERMEGGSFVLVKLPRLAPAAGGEAEEGGGLAAQADRLRLLTQALLDLYRKWEGLEMPLALAVTSAELNGAEVVLLDRYEQPPVQVSLSELNARLENFTTAAREPSPLRLEGRVNGGARLAAEGVVSPLSTEEPTELRLTLNELGLTRFSPYSERYVGYELSRGELALELDYTIRENLLRGDNRVIVDNLTFGASSGSDEAVKLPVKLAVALLKDANGRIELTVPLRGDLNDPSLDYGSLVAQAITRIIIGLVSSPFKMLGGLVPGGGEAELNEVRFAAGSAALTPESERTLDLLAEALRKRPQLSLVLRGEADPRTDGTVLRKEKLAEQFRAEWAALKKKPPEEPLPPEVYARSVREAYAALRQEEALAEQAAGEGTAEEGLLPAVAVAEPVPQPPRMRGRFRRPQPMTSAPPAAEQASVSTSQAEVAGEALPPPTLEEMEAALLAEITLAPSAYEPLRQARVEAVRTYLVERAGLDAARLSAGESATDEEAAPAQARVAFALE